MNGTVSAPAEASPGEQPLVEPEPQLPGTHYGELSPEGQWVWDGTGKPDDKWIANPEKAGVQAEQPEQLAAPTPGTAILATATIDSLFALAYGNRSAELAATPTYSWGTGNQIIANWPGVMAPTGNFNNNSAMFATFNARATGGSTITQ